MNCGIFGVYIHIELHMAEKAKLHGVGGVEGRGGLVPLCLSTAMVSPCHSALA